MMEWRCRVVGRTAFVVISGFLSLSSIGCISGDPNINMKTRFGFAQGRASRFLTAATGVEDYPLHQNYKLCVSERTWFDPSRRINHRYTIYDYLKCAEAPGPRRFVVAYDAYNRGTSLRDDPRSNVDIPDWEAFQQRALYQEPGDYQDLVIESERRDSNVPAKDLGKAVG